MSQVLVIDDKIEVRISLRAILEEGGYQVVEAKNGADAINQIQNNPQGYDMIITDIMMPEVDGVELMTALKIMNVDTPVLAMSGGGYAMDAQMMLKAASQVADHILSKPFTSDELFRAVAIANENKRKGVSNGTR